MKGYVVIFRLQARSTAWPHQRRSDQDFEFDYGTLLIPLGEPKIYYCESSKKIKFRLNEGRREYFADLNHFLKSTESATW